MKKTQKFVIAAVAALTLVLTGCNNGSQSSAPTNQTSAASSDSTVSKTESSAVSETTSSTVSETASALWESARYKEDTELGEGKNSVKIEVKADGKSVTLTIHSDSNNLEKILTENDLVEGDQSEFGLYIKKVNGIRADYDADKAYWALCKDGASTATGASGITVANDEHYEFVYTPA